MFLRPSGLLALSLFLAGAAAFVLGPQPRFGAGLASRRPPVVNRAPPAGRGGALFMAADYYQSLGVGRDADQAAIKQNFRKQARKYHPDVNKEPGADEKFAEIANAYEVLSDPEKRQMYDQFGEAGVRGSGMGGGGGAAGLDLEDLFESFFGGGMGGGMGGGGRGRQQQRGPRRGEDLRLDLDLDFNTAVFGGEERVRVRHLESCTTCTGDGVKPGASKRTCGTCNGAGVVTQVARTPLGAFQSQTACPACGGNGQIVDEFCGSCSGQGVVQETKQVKVSIPAGVEDGNKLRVRGEGDAAPKGGQAGDLYIFLKVKKDPQFNRDGIDIKSDVPISYIEAILGTKTRVPVVDGEVEIKVPAGTQPGTTLRIRGKGVPKLGDATTRGDHFVKIKVEIPKDVSAREKELLAELTELSAGKKKGGGFFGGK